MRNPFRAVGQFANAASYVNQLAWPAVSPQRGRASILAGLAKRGPTFVDMLERAVFAQAVSPYRVLLEHTGYTFERVRALVGEHGIEATLERLARDGVYVAIEEYKGKVPIRRGSLTLTVPAEAFDNPLTRGGLRASSGGTRSAGLWTTISTGNHRLGAHHLAVALTSYGLERAPVAVWLPYAHGASLWALLALAATRNTPPRWYTQLPLADGGVKMYLRSLGIRAAALVNGRRLPVAEHVPVGRESIILDWLAALRGRPAGLFTTPSSALRLALAARRQGQRLDGVTFVTIGEPLTAAKLKAVVAVGGRAYSSLGFTEYGRVTYGCPRPDGVDDGHVFSDAVAVVQHRRPVDGFGTELDVLLFTALRPDSRKILLNMETGDYATLSERACGCDLERAGLSLHMKNIRSFEKLNAEGRLFFGSELITLVEVTLPALFGGDPTDYQLVEEEDGQGFTRLAILVHPRRGRVDESAIIASVEEHLAGLHGVNQRVWNEVGTLRLRRAAPIITRAGKVMALHHLRAQDRIPEGAAAGA